MTTAQVDVNGPLNATVGLVATVLACVLLFLFIHAAHAAWHRFEAWLDDELAQRRWDHRADELGLRRAMANHPAGKGRPSTSQQMRGGRR